MRGIPFGRMGLIDVEQRRQPPENRTQATMMKITSSILLLC